MKLDLNRFEARERLRPKPARRSGLGGRVEFVVLCSYSPFRSEVCRLHARTHWRAWWLARLFLWAHPYGLALIRRRS